MNFHTHETPPTLSTGYDLLPLPSLEQFESDRNLPVPTRRITVDELVKVVHGEEGEDDLEAGVRKLGKVRLYGRVVQYLESEGVLIIDDPDTPKSLPSSVSSPTTSISTSKSRPRRANALPKIGITTSILSSHLHAASSSSSPHNNSSSTRNSTDRTSNHNSPRDLDAAHEYALGRYPAGSGQIQVGQNTGKTPTKNLSIGEGKEERFLRPVNFEPGRAVCVVGYLELFTPAHKEDEIATLRKARCEDEHEEESMSDKQRRRAWEEVKARGWAVNALQVMNVPVYEPVEDVGGSTFNLDTLEGKKAVIGTKGQMEVNAEAAWGRRSGLERYD